MKSIILSRHLSWLAACLLSILPLAATADKELVNNIVGLLVNVKKTPTASQQQQAGQALAGVWVNVGGQFPSILAISTEGTVYNKGRLGWYELSSYRSPYSSSELNDTLTSVLDEAGTSSENPGEDTIAGSIRAAVKENTRKRMESLLVIAREAEVRGERSLPKVHLRMHYSQTLERSEDDELLVLFYTDTRLYVQQGVNYVAYVRDDALPRADVDRWFGGKSVRDSRGSYMRSLRSAYIDLKRYCYQLLLDDQPVEDCRSRRDRAADLGMTLLPEDVHPRDMTIPVPTAAHQAFWDAPAAASSPGQQYLSRLDYCFDPASGSDTQGEAYRQFLSRLAARGFTNTLWSFQVNRSLPGAKPGNWSEQEYAEQQQYFGDFNSFPSGAKVFLRNDGVVGFSRSGGPVSFDPRNRWSLRDGALNLTFHDNAVWFRYPIRDNQPAEAETNLPLVEGTYLGLKLGDYQLYDYTHEVIALHPDAAELDALMRNPGCADGTFVADVSEQQTVHSAAVPDSVGLPDSFPRTWFARAELASGKKDPDPQRQAAMDKGIFYHLGEPDRLGTAASASGPFEYPAGSSWALDGNTLVWAFASTVNERYTFSLAPDYRGEASAVGAVNSQFRMVIVPAGTPVSAGNEEHTEPQSTTPVTTTPAVPETPPEWEIIGYWDYDAIDGQELKSGLVLRAKRGSRGPYSWQYQLDLVNHDKLPPRNRQLWPVHINRGEKKVCVDAPYPTFPGYIDLPGEQFDGVYTFASCKGGG